MSGYPYSPSQLGVRPSPALANQLLIGAFTWMFAGVLLSAGVARSSCPERAAGLEIAGCALPLIIGQFALVLGIQFLMPRISAHGRPRCCSSSTRRRSG